MNQLKQIKRKIPVHLLITKTKARVFFGRIKKWKSKKRKEASRYVVG